MSRNHAHPAKSASTAGPNRLFDQRPGVFEATRGVQSPCACPISIIGVKECDGWRAEVKIGRLLSAADLRQLAYEARRMADLFEERIDW
jgi:hypothetical protein